MVAAIITASLCSCGEQPEATVDFAFEMRSSRAPAPLLRFYASEVSMIDASGHRVAVRLDTANPWQDDNTAMLALGGRSDSGRTDNRAVTGRVPKGSYEALEFLLGIAFERNHGNPLKAPPPLNVPSMFWTWQSGYKFLRLDAGTEWSFHLGSTGCVSASAVRPPGEPCRQPNLARVRLPSGAIDGGTIAVDLDGLLAAIDTASDENCMGAYHERQSCRSLLTALGLDPDTGRCIDGCRHQAVFSLVDPLGADVSTGPDSTPTQ